MEVWEWSLLAWLSWNVFGNLLRGSSIARVFQSLEVKNECQHLSSMERVAHSSHMFSYSITCENLLIVLPIATIHACIRGIYLRSSKARTKPTPATLLCLGHSSCALPIHILPTAAILTSILIHNVTINLLASLVLRVLNA